MPRAPSDTPRRLVASCLVGVLLGSGCGSPSCDVLAELDPSVELGVGEGAFEPTQDGDTLTFSYGNQGGRHIWVALRTVGLHAGGEVPPPNVHVWVDDVDGTVLEMGPQRVQLQPTLADPRIATVTGRQMFGIVHPDTHPWFYPEPNEGNGEQNEAYARDQLARRTWTYRAEIKDGCRRSAQTSRVVKLGDVPEGW